MRGSFANPPPAAPLDVDCSYMGVGKLRKGVRVADEDVLKSDGVEALARRNFRVGVVVPEVVERLDLAADDSKARRWVWWWVGDAEVEGAVEGWKGVETWP